MMDAAPAMGEATKPRPLTDANPPSRKTESSKKGESMPFEFSKLQIPDVILVKLPKFHDWRGFFSETYKKSVFAENGINADFKQDNCSLSKKGVLRGLHYQLAPAAQGKLVRVVSGKVFDVAIDIRRSSPHFGKWVSYVLSAEEGNALWIPEGFAHGFLAMEDDTIVNYKTTSEYSKEHERGIIWNDSAISINWPIREPIVSEKDNVYPNLSDADLFS